MKKIIDFITSAFILLILCSCSAYKSQGYVITKGRDTLRGKVNYSYINNPAFIHVNHQKIPTLNVESLGFYSKKNDTTKYEPIDSINLWLVVAKEKNVGIYYMSWETSPYEMTDIGYKLILKSTNEPPIPMLNPDTNYFTPWNFGSIKIKTTPYITRREVPALLAFINFRYRQHLSYNDFMNNKNRVIVQRMFNYILDKENKQLQRQTIFLK